MEGHIDGTESLLPVREVARADGRRSRRATRLFRGFPFGLGDILSPSQVTASGWLCPLVVQVRARASMGRDLAWPP
jgi:hypothetical protein